LPDNLFSGLIRVYTLLMANNSLTRLKDSTFQSLSALTTFNVANNQITVVEPQVFGSLLLNPNLNSGYALWLDMSGNPSQCRIGWLPEANSSVVYCHCDSEMLGTIVSSGGGTGAVSTVAFSTGCSPSAKLGIVSLPSTMISSNASATVDTSNSSSNVQQLVKETLCLYDCCYASSAFEAVTGNSTSNATVFHISLNSLEATGTYDGSCLVAPGFRTAIVACADYIFATFSDYVAYSQTSAEITLPPPTTLSLQFTQGQANSFPAVTAALLPSPTVSSAVTFAVEPHLPAGLVIDAFSGEIGGRPVSSSPPSVFHLSQLTRIGGSQPCVNVLAVLTISAISCDTRTCHGGVCLLPSSGDLYGEARCACPSGQAGRYCEFVNPFVVSRSSTDRACLLSIFLALCVSVAAVAVHAAVLKWTSAQQHTSLLSQRLLETEEEMVILQRAWQIQPSELAVEREVARGAFGVVLKAVWNDMAVAVKMLGREPSSMESAAAEEFDREVSFMRTVRHANIVLFLGAGVFENGVPFLVTEFMERGSLRVVLENSPDIAWPKKLSFARDTALGMQHLHALGCIHRDLKSGNLLVTRTFGVKVADFGTSRLAGMSKSTKGARHGPQHHQQHQQHQHQLSAPSADQDADPTLTTLVGTSLWMAPEILFKQPYTQKADVYSYGIVLFEILTQTTPWNELPSKFLVNHLSAALNAGQRPTLPDEVATAAATSAGQTMYIQLMHQCWAQSPAERPSFDEVLAGGHLSVDGEKM
jgi:hypothetical protein